MRSIATAMRQPPAADSWVPATCHRLASSRVAGTVTLPGAPRERHRHAAYLGRRRAQGVEDGGRHEVLAGSIGRRRDVDEQVVGVSARQRGAHDRSCDSCELRPAGGSAREQERRGDEHPDRRDRLGPEQSHRRPQAAHGEQSEQPEGARGADRRELGDERPSVGRREQRIEARNLTSGAVEPGHDDHGHAGGGQTAEAPERLEHVAPLESGQDERKHDQTADPEAACEDVRGHREDRESAERRGVTARSLGRRDGHEQGEREPALPQRERDEHRDDREFPYQHRVTPCGIGECLPQRDL